MGVVWGYPGLTVPELHVAEFFGLFLLFLEGKAFLDPFVVFKVLVTGAHKKGFPDDFSQF
jgi:hypothetical protein